MANTFNIGRNASLSIIVNGAPINPALITGFSHKQKAGIATSRPINAQPQHMKIPEGWSGEIMFDRANSVLDTFFSGEEANFWAGGQQPTITILYSILDPSTNITNQFRFDGVVLTYEDGGEIKAEDKVPQKVHFEANQRVQVA
jgi:hypothetical protein